jgi:hypothetical protein
LRRITATVFRNYKFMLIFVWTKPLCYFNIQVVVAV